MTTLLDDATHSRNNADADPPKIFCFSRLSFKKVQHITFTIRPPPARSQPPSARSRPQPMYPQPSLAQSRPPLAHLPPPSVQALSLIHI